MNAPKTASRKNEYPSNRASRIDREQCIISLICASVVVVCVCIGVVMNLTTLYDENFDHMGIRTFCMFTVNSNILVGVGMFLTIPYSIDELRRKSYFVPPWLVTLLFVLVTAVAITFLVSLFILAPVKGFALIFTGSRFFLHGVCPILSILTFCFFIKDHELPFRSAFLALIPVFLYACVYYVMVRVIGEEHGGWNDFYGFLTRAPAWISITFALPVTFGVALLLRMLHNGSARRFRKEVSKELEAITASGEKESVISTLGEVYGKRADPNANINIPRRMISAIAGKEADREQIDSLCRVYLDAFLAAVPASAAGKPGSDPAPEPAPEAPKEVS